MCGRTACTLGPSDICNACGYKNKQGKQSRPQWRGGGGGGGGGTTDGSSHGKQYYTSYNVGPHTYTPILVSKATIDEDTKSADSTDERVVMPMKWGLVPSWHKGSPNKFGYSTMNCRDDSLTQKAMFKKPLERGRRCVILADGFFEWKKTKDGKKQPYFIYFPQDTKVWSESEQKPEDNYDSEGNWIGRKLLTMAGIYDVVKPKNEGEEPHYTYTIITVPASPELSWLHDRMPAILDGDDAVHDWLDSGNIDKDTALKRIKSTGNIQYHPVSTVVNSIRNKNPECIVPVDLDKPKPESKLMAAWLSKGSKTAGMKMESSPAKSPKKRPAQNLLTSWVKREPKSPSNQKQTDDGSPTAKRVKTE
ncbi:abasic site processing protein HMCES-like [Glandiceps talaboti]